MCRCYLVEDDHADQMFVERVVGRLPGVELSIFNDLDQAIDEGEDPDVLIMDLKAGPYEEDEAVKKAVKKWPIAGVIILSGTDNFNTLMKVVRHQITDFLSKSNMGKLDLIRAFKKATSANEDRQKLQRSLESLEGRQRNLELALADIRVARDGGR